MLPKAAAILRKPLKPTLLAVKTLPAAEPASIVDDEEKGRAEEEDKRRNLEML